MMDAEQVRSLFSDAYDGELGETDQRSFDAALADAPELRDEFESFCEVLSETALLGSDKISIPSIDLLPAVQRKISERTRGRYFRESRYRNPSMQSSWLLMMLLVVLCVGAAIWMALTFVDDSNPEDSTSETSAVEVPAEPSELGLLGTEEPVSCVPEARDDVSLFVQMRIDRGGINRHIG